MNSFCAKLGIELPIIQAPMAGVSTAKMAAAVSNAGALGSISVGASNAASARAMIADVRAQTDRPFNVNVFCHQPAVHNAEKESAWRAFLAPVFSGFEATPPVQLREIYTSFVADDAMLDVLTQTRPAIVSFHFGLPSAARIAALKSAGITLLATATNLAEARAIERSGVDAIVAQGFEAGGHRGVFDPQAQDSALGTLAFTRLLVANIALPIIATGGVMDGATIAACLALGASAAQLGTAFVGCFESAADENYRAALFSDDAHHTVMTIAISGRPARCLPNRFTALGATIDPAAVPMYPIAYDAGKALNAAAKAKNVAGYGAQWAGQGAPLARNLRAADLVATLAAELRDAQQRRPVRN